MLLRLTPFLLVVCLLFASIDRKDSEKPRTLTQKEMTNLVGGHAGASCDTCGDGTVRQDECAHFTQTDSCSSSQCIENWITEDTCQVAEQSNCWAELNIDLDYLVQYLRSDSGCTTSNPSTWNVWKVHYYESTCTSKTYKTRCEKASNNCNGTLVSTSTRPNAIECI